MKRFLIVLAVLLALLGVGVGLSVFSARYALQAIELQRHDILGLAIEIGDYAIDWHKASLSLKRVKIYPAGHEEEGSLLASADELAISIAPHEVLHRVVHAREVTLVKPKISLLATRQGFNWDALHLTQGEKTPSEKSAGKGAWSFVIDAMRIEGGDVDYRDQVKGHHIELHGFELRLTDIVTEEDPTKLPTKLSLHGQLDATSGDISVDGMLNAFAPGINFALTATLSGTPIGYFRSYYAGSSPYPIQAGSIAVQSRAKCERSQLRSNHHASISGLRVGGGLKAQLINKYVLSRGGRIDIDATVGGDLSEGEFSVGTAIANNFNNVINAQAKDFASSMAGKALKEVGTQVEGKVKGAIPSSPVKPPISTPIDSKVKGLLRR
jgi:hypothetical protein